MNPYPSQQTPDSPETNALDHLVFNWLKRAVDKADPETRCEGFLATRRVWHCMTKEVVLKFCASMANVHRKIVELHGSNVFSA
jgi:hypothetical protein